MRELTHPFVKYGAAVVMRANNLLDIKDITHDHLKDEIENSMNHFRLKPISKDLLNTSVKFTFCNDEKGKAENGVYLAPNILSNDKNSGYVYNSYRNVIKELKNKKVRQIDATRGISTVSGEFSSFGDSGKISRGRPKTSIEVAAFSLITNTTPHKPSFVLETFGKKGVERENIGLIPDLKLNFLIDFINLFEIMKNQSTQGIMKGNLRIKDGRPLRPRIFDGNFPYAPKSNILGAIALLGAIGSWAKEAGRIEWAKKVLDSLKGQSIYLIGIKTFETFKYNHFIIELAKESKLSFIIDSIYFSEIHNVGVRFSLRKINYKKLSKDQRKKLEEEKKKNFKEYEKFDLFASRFLQLFTVPAFKDFLSFRAEYPNQFESLLNKYFINMEKIKLEVVKSARELGKWLNYAAYKVADRNVDSNVPDRNNKVRDQKAKSLIEIESSIFSARSGDALIFQAITRAGRASGLDAPSEAELFMTETSTGRISLESAKHLLIAFSRVRNRYEKNTNITIEGNDNGSDLSTTDDLSDAQE